MKILKRDYFLREQILGADLTYNTQVSDEKDVHCTMHIMGSNNATNVGITR